MLRTLALSACLLAATPTVAFEGENLLAAMPQGYKVGFQQKKGAKQSTEMVPAGETVQAWTEMVTGQLSSYLPGGQTCCAGPRH